MSDKPIKDGGPAFPHTLDMVSGGNVRGGMSLRDYFAAHALQGLLRNDESDDFARKVIAEDSYAMADAMIQAREAKP